MSAEGAPSGEGEGPARGPGTGGALAEPEAAPVPSRLGAPVAEYVKGWQAQTSILACLVASFVALPLALLYALPPLAGLRVQPSLEARMETRELSGADAYAAVRGALADGPAGAAERCWTPLPNGKIARSAPADGRLEEVPGARPRAPRPYGGLDELVARSELERAERSPLRGRAGCFRLTDDGRLVASSHDPRDPTRFVELTDFGLAPVVGGVGRFGTGALVFAFGGAALAFVTRRRILLPTLLGAGVAAAIPALSWLSDVGYRASVFLRPLHVEADTYGASLPSLFVFPMTLFVYVGSAVLAAALATLAVDGARGLVRCGRCDATFAAEPQVASCPGCGDPQTAQRVRLPLVFAGGAFTAALYLAFMRFAGPALEFYFRCTYADPDRVCRDAWREMTPMWVAWAVRGGLGDPGATVLYHPVKYVAFVAPLVAIAPYLIGRFLPRGAFRTSYACVVFNWVALTALAFFLMGSLKLAGVNARLVTLQLVALLPWCAVGAAGAHFGNRARMSSEAGLLAELEG